MEIIQQKIDLKVKYFCGCISVIEDVEAYKLMDQNILKVLEFFLNYGIVCTKHVLASVCGGFVVILDKSTCMFVECYIPEYWTNDF